MKKANEREAGSKKDIPAIFRSDAFARILIGLAWPTPISANQLRPTAAKQAIPGPELLDGLLAKGRQEAIALGADEAILDRLAEEPGLAECCARLILSDIVEMGDLVELSDLKARRGLIPSGETRFNIISRSQCVGNMAQGIFYALVADRRASDPGELSSALAVLAESPAISQGARMAMEGIQNATETYEKTPWGIFAKAVQELPSSLREELAFSQLAERGESMAYIEELEGWTNARNIMARQALILESKDPAERLAFQKICAFRMNLSFAQMGAATLEEILPNMEAPEKKAPSAKKINSLGKDLRKEGIAGKIALAAMAAFNLEAETAQGLVGEAKKALFEHCGLSPASWRAAIGSAQIADLLISSLVSRANLGGAVEKREHARAAKAAAKEKMSRQIAEEGTRWLTTKFGQAVALDAATEKSDMAARVANGASVKNLSKESTQRLFAALSHLFFAPPNEARFEHINGHVELVRDQRVSTTLSFILSGRDPVPKMPQSSLAAARQTIEEIDSVQRQSARWVQIISGQLDKRVAKALAAAGETADSERDPEFSDPGTSEAIMNWMESQHRLEQYGQPWGDKENMLRNWGITKEEVESLRGQPRPSFSPWVAAHKEALAGFMNDLGLWVDFLCGSPKGYFSTLPEDFGWGTIMRHQEQWHADEIARKIDAHPAAAWTWPTPCGAIAEGSFSAMPIANGRELILEGQKMQHCVSSYAERCAKGHAHILSVSKHGVPFCTMELRAFNSKGQGIDVLAQEPSGKPPIKVHAWEIVQNKGRHNAPIEDPEALAFARHARDRYAAAFEAIANPKEQAVESLPKRSIAEKALARRQASEARPGPKA